MVEPVEPWHGAKTGWHVSCSRFGSVLLASAASGAYMKPIPVILDDE
jgi:hypothetical protein